MRLEGRTKAGYYPTPPKTLEGLAALLGGFRKALEGEAALDPCAGEGEALARVAEATGTKPYAIELDEERAKACRARLAPLGGTALQGDSLEVEGAGFRLLWLNPPYDWAEPEDGRRLEVLFLRHWWPALVPDGVLVLLIPEKVVPAVWPMVAREAAEGVVFALPEGERERFGQVVVLARKQAYTWQSLPEEPPKPLPWEKGLKEAQEVLEGLWPPGDKREKPVLRTRPQGLEGALAEARHSPLWTAVEAQTVAESGGFRPLLPLRQAHLALLVAGGLLDLQEVVLDGVPHAVLGTLRKDTVEIEEETEEGRKRIEREVFRVGLVLLNLRTGALTEVA
ncbi:DUF6094 domain-containing protein [Thermus scotoductus]|uniref:SAM-dependent methyltransferase n=1 Tax=Thermus scotoductus TaxID=37636 RepID=A0A430RE98_THESC|nr:DUF6094 domain-containing protein [Thermus scotoductus]RTG97626.1 SAM-dependent methyltransferase [Thermus scotoductus]RTH05697.1 SAM-dependent methyltransferase [Thermus scotoductus]RTH22227.1 SAM-dependent methyltransferase [Thermus scotoductus]RTI01816.1 SAM-dependent methyltransferase [Thermus scotoductus]RTI24197.1 SAM-dependent methyltransferase [Thermus scotoductus]